MRSGCTDQCIILSAREGEATVMSIQENILPSLEVNVGWLVGSLMTIRSSEWRRDSSFCPCGLEGVGPHSGL